MATGAFLTWCASPRDVIPRCGQEQDFRSNEWPSRPREWPWVESCQPSPPPLLSATPWGAVCGFSATWWRWRSPPTPFDATQEELISTFNVDGRRLKEQTILPFAIPRVATGKRSVSSLETHLPARHAAVTAAGLLPIHLLGVLYLGTLPFCFPFTLCWSWATRRGELEPRESERILSCPAEPVGSPNLGELLQPRRSGGFASLTVTYTLSAPIRPGVQLSHPPQVYLLSWVSGLWITPTTKGSLFKYPLDPRYYWLDARSLQVFTVFPLLPGFARLPCSNLANGRDIALRQLAGQVN